MSFTSITVPNQGDPTRRQLIADIISDLNDLNARLATGDKLTVPNGSFELDGDSDGIPDSWARTLYTSGAFTLTGDGLSDTACAHGSRAVKFTSPGGSGNGGGYLTSSSYFEVTPLRTMLLTWLYQATASTLAMRVEVDWYTAAQAFIQTDVIFTVATGLPSSWAQAYAYAVPPSTARYAKWRLIGCHTSSTTAGSIYFDNVFASLLDFRYRTEFEGTGTSATVYNWTCPTGVNVVRVTAIGGGAAGGSEASSGNTYGGGGGGSGQMAISVIPVTPGTVYAISVGGGGLHGAAGVAGGAGGDTTWATSVVIAKGGSGGGPGTTGAGGAGGTGGTGQILTTGLPGTAGLASSSGGDGGPSVSGAAGGRGPASGAGAGPIGTKIRGAGGSGAGFTASALGGDGGPGSFIIEF